MEKRSPVTGQVGYPGEGWKITSGYATERYFQLFGAWHTGHDLAKSAAGGETLFSILDGVVKWAEFAGNGGFGNLVFIEHIPNQLYSRYGHLERITVTRNQVVTAGQAIGILGNTGRSTAPHLHFDVSKINNALDWPNKDRERVFRDYYDPGVWFADGSTISLPDSPSSNVLAPTDESTVLIVAASGGLNVRAQANPTAPITQRLSFNTEVRVRQGSQKAGGFTWRELVSGGWIAQEFTNALAAPPTPVVTPPPTPVAPPPPIITAPRAPLLNLVRVIVQSGLNVRATPDSNAPIIQKLQFGVEVELRGEPQQKGAFIWRELRSGGWIAINFTEALSSSQPAEATLRVEFSRLRVTPTNGLNVRAEPNPNAPILRQLPKDAEVDVKPESRTLGSFTWRELVSGGWIAQEFTVRVTGGTSAVSAAPVASVQVAGRGVHTSAGGWSPTDQELDFVRHNRAQSALIVAYEPNQASMAIPRLRSVGVRDFIIRAASHQPIGRNPQDFINDTLPRLREYHAAIGGPEFLIALHNEPNLNQEGLTRAWNTPQEFSEWYLAVAQAYRNAFSNAKIGFPAMSPGGTVAGIRQDEWQFVAGCGPAISASDWVGVHAYFVGDGSDIDLKAQQWRQMAGGRSIIITEGGPADNILNTGQKLTNVYNRCEREGFPVMAWLLSGAGAWQSAGWIEQNVRV